MPDRETTWPCCAGAHRVVTPYDNCAMIMRLGQVQPGDTVVRLGGVCG